MAWKADEKGATLIIEKMLLHTNLYLHWLLNKGCKHGKEAY